MQHFHVDPTTHIKANYTKHMLVVGNFDMFILFLYLFLFCLALTLQYVDDLTLGGCLSRVCAYHLFYLLLVCCYTVRPAVAMINCVVCMRSSNITIQFLMECRHCSLLSMLICSLTIRPGDIVYTQLCHLCWILDYCIDRIIDIVNENAVLNS